MTRLRTLFGEREEKEGEGSTVGGSEGGDKESVRDSLACMWKTFAFSRLLPARREGDGSAKFPLTLRMISQINLTPPFPIPIPPPFREPAIFLSLLPKLFADRSTHFQLITPFCEKFAPFPLLLSRVVQIPGQTKSSAWDKERLRPPRNVCILRALPRDK